jgi:hypothetical protein
LLDDGHNSAGLVLGPERIMSDFLIDWRCLFAVETAFAQPADCTEPTNRFAE